QQQFLSATGATATSAKPGAKEVTFEPLATLAPKETAVWRVLVKCVDAGDVRFHTQVTSAQHNRPIIKTEATSIFAPAVAGTPAHAAPEAGSSAR
ncbi:MAG: hypothetical protein FWC56_04815, partial [Phycisphaerae bacterium]|nr:hypothetical protein [Phycisphaerae bacterium]